MKLSKFLMTVILICLVSLFYVHQQIELIKLSYKIHSNQQRFDNLLDQTKILEYNVIALKAPTSLESHLKAKNVKLVSPERWQVVNIASWRIEEDQKASEKSLPRMVSFLELFTSGREAQAKPTN